MSRSGPDLAREEQEAVMTDAQLDEILAHIDAAVGPPDAETEAEHEARRQMIERDHRARAIRKHAQHDVD